MIGISVVTGIISGMALPLFFFALEFAIERRALRKAKLNGRKIWWSLMPERRIRNFETGVVERTGKEIEFDPRHGHYMKCGELVVTLASASLVFIPSLRFSSALPWMGLPMVLLGFTVVYSLAFMALLTYFYEMQLQNPDSFTVLRSCGLFALGFGALSCFAIAYFILAVLVGNALSHGSMISAGH